MAFAVRSRTAEILWLLWGQLVCLTVLATGNHAAASGRACRAGAGSCCG
jgi:hypothetical protein